MEQILITLCIWLNVGLQTAPPATDQSTRDLYARAAAAIASADPKSAIEPLEQLVAAAPKSSVAQIAVVHLAECYVQSSRCEEAAELLREWSDRIEPKSAAIAIDPNLVAHHARVWLHAAHRITSDNQAIESLNDLCAHLDTLTSAKAARDELAELTQTLNQARHELASRYVTTNQIAPATKQLEKCCESTAAAEEELLVLQILNTRQSNAPELTRTKLVELALHEPLTRRTAEARLELATELSREAKLTEAVTMIEPLRQSEGFDSDFNCRLWLLASEIELGRNNAQQAVAALPDNETLSTLTETQQIAIRFARAEALAEAHDRLAALEDLKWLSEHNQQNTATWAPAVELRRCEMLLAEKRYEDLDRAATAAKTTYIGFDKCDEFEYLQARAAIQKIDFERAREYLQTIVESLSKPERVRPVALARAQWMLGEVDFLEQKYLAAIDAYSVVIHQSSPQPWTTLALLQTGKCFELLNKNSDALAVYERVVLEAKDEKLRNEAHTRIAAVKQIATANDKSKLRR